jgi:hypothetical protein
MDSGINVSDPFNSNPLIIMIYPVPQLIIHSLAGDIRFGNPVTHPCGVEA